MNDSDEKQINDALFNPAPENPTLSGYTNAADPPGPSLSLDDLEQTLNLLSRPHPLAIWFTGLPAEYRRVERLLYEQGCAVNDLKFDREAGRFTPVPFGLRIYNFTLAEVKETRQRMLADGLTPERRDHLYPFEQPGIWVQMSDGNHYQILFVKNALEKIIMELVAGGISRN